MKRCSRCQEFKAPACFHTDRSRPDGKNIACRSCRADADALAKAKISACHDGMPGVPAINPGPPRSVA